MFTEDCKGITMKEKNIKAAEKWQHISAEEKKTYTEAAKNLKRPDLSSLDEKQKEKLVSAHKKSLIKEVMINIYRFHANILEKENYKQISLQ
jgi:hypothetical protein